MSDKVRIERAGTVLFVDAKELVVYLRRGYVVSDASPKQVTPPAADDLQAFTDSYLHPVTSSTVHWDEETEPAIEEKPKAKRKPRAKKATK